MKVVDHPYLEGVKCREDGAVFVPWGGRRKGSRWTFGHEMKSGYRDVCVRKGHYYVHRLVAEAFHGLCPEDKKVVDHIDRDKSNNRPENLRWATVSENGRNSLRSEESLRKFGASSVDDVNTYQRNRYANNPEFRERQKARQRERYANDPAYREHIHIYNHEYYARKRA